MTQMRDSEYFMLLLPRQCGESWAQDIKDTLAGKRYCDELAVKLKKQQERKDDESRKG